jgi:poly-gamma-glutamate synthesis protein (capsule biosynthesis protein)
MFRKIMPQALDRRDRPLVPFGTALFLAGAFFLAAVRPAWPQPAPLAYSNPPYNRDPASETAMKIAAPFTVAAVGDVIAPQPLDRSDPSFRKLTDRIRQSDVGFANMESSLIDFRDFAGAVGGTEAPYAMGETLKAMGVTIVNHANNHAFDGGAAGMISTDRALDRLGIVHAGSGRNLQEARAPSYLETPKGRVGLVGMFSIDNASNFGPSYTRTEATDRVGNLGGAPGVNPLHLTRYQIVSAGQLKQMRQMARAAYGENAPAPPPTGPDRLRYYDEWFQAGPDVGSVHYEINPDDERKILEAVRNGKIYSDFMMVSIHAHQTTRFLPQAVNAGPDGVPPIKEGLEHDTPDFLVKLAHDSIDNGADMFVVHGPHTLRGVEIYKGKPIFYGISNFIFQFGLQLGPSYDIKANEKNMAALENDDSQAAVLTTSHFENGKLTEVRLYPADLGGPRRPISQMGIPLTPSPQQAQRILKNLQDYSKVFGTNIAIQDNVGVIRVSPEGRAN